MTHSILLFFVLSLFMMVFMMVGHSLICNKKNPNEFELFAFDYDSSNNTKH